ncbi:MAG: ribonuclease H [Gemmatimonadota bacterium]
MAALPIRIWLEIDHQTTFRSGGWAFVLAEGSALSGVAGGERGPSAERIALAGLAEALKGAPPAAAVEVRTASAAVLAAYRRLTNTDDPPAEDLELWAQIATSLKGRPVRFAPAPAAPRTPGAFAAAWAELARDKAKTRPFRAAIPKTNLAKAGVPA